MANTIEGLTPAQQRALNARRAAEVSAQRQAAASTARYDRSGHMVVTAPDTAADEPSSTLYGVTSGGGGGAAAAAAAAAAEATANANTSARSSANSQKTALQQAISP